MAGRRWSVERGEGGAYILCRCLLCSARVMLFTESGAIRWIQQHLRDSHQLHATAAVYGSRARERGHA